MRSNNTHGCSATATSLPAASGRPDPANPKSKIQNPKFLRSAFTLVELLVTISIIAILASMILFAMYSAQETARDAKTRNTIAKIDAVLMPLYTAYKTRRVPIDALAVAEARGFPTSTPKQELAAKSRARLDALRELMRMELPDRWSDISEDPGAWGTPAVGLARPAVSRAYRSRWTTVQTQSELLTNQGAECLYLILSKMGEEGLEAFRNADIGDTDGDDAKEILDGWGNPIHFLRWPAGFLSELQTGEPFTDTNLNGIRDGTESYTDLNGDGKYDPRSPDAFDPRRVYPQTGQTQQTFGLYPLIYSAGPDGVPGILEDLASYRAVNNNPFAGTPQVGTEDQEFSLDNVHNHYIGRRP